MSEIQSRIPNQKRKSKTPIYKDTNQKQNYKTSKTEKKTPIKTQNSTTQKLKTEITNH